MIKKRRRDSECGLGIGGLYLNYKPLHQVQWGKTLRRDQRAMEESHFLAGLLYPNKHLQERLYTILPFLAKHGFELIDTIHDAIRPECPDHCVLTI